MSNKIHVNPETGAVGPCKANQNPSSKGCPFSGESGIDNHFDSREEAQRYSEKLMKEKHGSGLQSVKKTISLIENDATENTFNDLKNEKGQIVFTSPEARSLIGQGMANSAKQIEREYRKETSRTKSDLELETQEKFCEALRDMTKNLNSHSDFYSGLLNEIEGKSAHETTETYFIVQKAIINNAENFPTKKNLESIYQIEKISSKLNKLRGDKKFKSAFNLESEYTEKELKERLTEVSENIINNDPATKKNSIKGFFLKKLSENENPGSEARLKYAHYISSRDRNEVTHDLGEVRGEYRSLSRQESRYKMTNYIKIRAKEEGFSLSEFE